MKQFLIDAYLVNETDKAIGVRVKRSDGVWIPGFVYFPKSQCEVINKGSKYKVTIPEWLYNKKVSYCYSIVTC
jgi:hypothetical protein